MNDDTSSACFAYNVLRQNFGEYVGFRAFANADRQGLDHVRRRCRSIRYACDRALGALEDLYAIYPVQR